MPFAGIRTCASNNVNCSSHFLLPLVLLAIGGNADNNNITMAEGKSGEGKTTTGTTPRDYLTTMTTTKAGSVEASDAMNSITDVLRRDLCMLPCPVLFVGALFSVDRWKDMY